MTSSTRVFGSDTSLYFEGFVAERVHLLWSYKHLFQKAEDSQPLTWVSGQGLGKWALGV